ncbi:MAG TPA: metal ABC transporter substrate-binding protein [Candidatus Limnocylindrales bacterium]|nr:metal ABC transporter substrate-binding protein [Candidatus Limnocylindrales bacterium]
MRRFIALVAVLAVAGCSNGSRASGPADTRIPVVATTTVFADLVRSVGGDLVKVDSLVPKGGDVHTFDPRPSDAGRLEDARLVVANGLGLDDWLASLAKDSGTKADMLHLADSVAPDAYIVEDGIPNPHLWLDPSGAAAYAGAIAESLSRLDPGHAATYAANNAAFGARLDGLRTWGAGLVAAVPQDRRTLISFHDALPYFARAYGVEIAGVIVKSPGQDPSAADIAGLVTAIRANDVRVVVSEVQFSDKLARTVAAETGATIVSDIYDDSLGDPPVDSYEGLVRYDLERLVAGLKGSG